MRENEHQIPGIRPYFEINEEGLESIASLLASGQVTNNGYHLQRFERLLAEYLGVKETVAVSSGSDALLLALRALSLPQGKAVLPAYTYIATLNAVVHAGLDPVFCDIDAATFTLDPNHLTELIDKNPDIRCVLPVNVFGVPCDLFMIRKICDRIGATVLYDNAHGFGTEVDGCRIATDAEVQIFSFHATKTLPAVEGGLVVSENPAVLSMTKRLRNHGLGQSPSDTIPGFNAKMDEIRAIIGIHSLNNFCETILRRRYYGHRLSENFKRFADVYKLQSIPAKVNTNFQNLGVCCPCAARKGLDYVIKLFKNYGIGVRSYFDPPLHKIKGFDERHALPVTEAVWQTLISVPIHSRMTDVVLNRIEEATCSVAKVLRSLD